VRHADCIQHDVDAPCALRHRIGVALDGLLVQRVEGRNMDLTADFLRHALELGRGPAGEKKPRASRP
jgi:hypothetical protein